MIQKINTTKMVCDNCNNEVSDTGETRFGGSIFQGWFNVEQISGSTALPELQKQRNFNFCSCKCLGEFADTLQMPKAAEITEEHSSEINA